MRHEYRARTALASRLGTGRFRLGQAALGVVLSCACTAHVDDPDGGITSGGSSSGGVFGAAGGQIGTPLGGTAPANPGGEGGTAAGAGAGAAPTGAGGSASPGGASSGGAAGLDCSAPRPGRSPLRRLTTREYNNTVRDLFGDTTNPGDLLPPQTDSKGNWFGNDADYQSVTDTLIEKYQSIAEGVAARATVDTTALGRLHACAGKTVAAADEEGCARSIAQALAPRAYRRATTTTDIDELVALYRSTRPQAASFASGVAGMLEGLLQSPDFLYRVELGAAATGGSPLRRVTGREMATRLSYFLWQTMPDASLFEAADAGGLDTSEGVASAARTLLNDKKSHATVAFFFDNFLPIPDLPGLARQASQFPTWSSSVGSAMRAEVHRVIEHEVFENTVAAGAQAAGSWPALLTSPYTFVNETLFKFYGPSTFAAGTNVTGSAFQKVSLNTQQRLGVLTLGGTMAGSTTSNRTNPVLRGIFIINKVMCSNLELPAGFSPPEIDPYSGKTARERVAKHSQDKFCAGCHQVIDPVGLPFESYDPVGLYRTAEKWTDPNTNMTYETPIDASGAVPGVPGATNTAVELVQKLAASESVESCFASNWMQFAYGRSLDSADACNSQSVLKVFKDSNYNVKQLLLALTQTDAFLYRAND